MKKTAAVIVDGKVENLIVVPDSDFSIEGAALVEYEVKETTVSPGFTYDGENFSPPEE